MSQKEKIMVTGGAGFIGSHIVDLLIDKGYEVIVVDNLSGGRKDNINKQAVFYRMDINDLELKDVFEKEKPIYICHQAAQISVSTSVKNPKDDAWCNIMGLLNILEFARRYQVKGIVFASSGGTVYGEPTILPVNEQYPFYPSSPYGITKMTSEYYLKFYAKHYGLNYISLRYGNVYGPRQDPYGEAGVIAIFIKKMLNKEVPTINGDGEYVRDYIYVEDVAAACLLSIKNMLKLSRLPESSNVNDTFHAFNIGTGKGVSVNQLFAYLRETIGFSFQPNYGPPRPGDLRKNILNCQKAKKYLEWQPKQDIINGLKKTVYWFRKQYAL